MNRLVFPVCFPPACTWANPKAERIGGNPRAILMGLSRAGMK